MSVRIQTGSTERIEALALSAALVPLTGLTDLLLSIRRVSDGFYFDFADLTFKNSGWTTRRIAMTEVSSTNAPGEYIYNFNTATITNPTSDDTYEIRVDQSPGTTAKNVPQTGEIKVGQFIDDIDSPISSRAAPGAAMDLIADAVDASAIATSGAQEIRDSILADSTPFNGANIAAIKAKTDNLPIDPADESLIEAAIAALNDLSIADVQTALTAQGYTPGRATLLDNLNATITSVLSSIAALNDLSQADVQSAMTAQGYTIARAALLDNLNAAISAVLSAIAALNDLSIADVQTALTNQGYTTARAILISNLDMLLSTIPTAVEFVLSGLHGSGSWEGGTPADISDAVWDKSLTGHSLPGTFGQEVQGKAEPGDAMTLTSGERSAIRAAIMTYIVNANILGLTVEQSLDMCRKILNNRLELQDGDTDNWKLYDDDDSTVLLKYNVRDKSGGGIAIQNGMPARRSRGA